MSKVTYHSIGSIMPFVQQSSDACSPDKWPRSARSISTSFLTISDFLPALEGTRVPLQVVHRSHHRFGSTSLIWSSGSEVHSLKWGLSLSPLRGRDSGFSSVSFPQSRIGGESSLKDFQKSWCLNEGGYITPRKAELSAPLTPIHVR